MTIKTITTYKGYNYGASLQAYALQTYLTKLGHDVEIIRYHPRYLMCKYDYHWVNPESKLNRWPLTRAIYRVLKYLQRQTTMGRKRAFDRFTQTMLKETERCYTSYEEICQSPPEADLYIAGSDQIWNVLYEAGRDPAFYLEFVRKGRKASYAASFSYMDIDEDNRKRIGVSLGKFDAVSVREQQGVKLLEEMGVRGECVLDPVFLLSVDEWRAIMTDFRKTEPYILVYDFEGDRGIRHFAQDYARRHGLKIYAIVDTYPLLYAHRNFHSAGPQDFITLIYHCDAFVSNSFHGTAFSIMFRKPVYLRNRRRHPVNCRLQYLVFLFHLEGCLEPTSEVDFDWTMIEKIRRQEVERSKAFLDNLLGC